MRFTLIKDLKQDALMKPILSGLLIFTLLYLLADVFVKQYTLGLFYDEIFLNLFGNEEEFLDPMLKSSFLEFWHIEIFFIMMLLLTLSAVFIRLYSNTSFNLLVLNTMLLSALLCIISIALSFFASEVFIHIYIISFFIWHILALYMSIYSLWNLHYDPSL
ncbi:MAG: hypothetical protein Q9M32_08905 [Sulfurimonas sp.]|nr:hypothetical protein [Sulfurimonas sp.]MDQ7062248.1 hypothetical protein [Sulfurimonas sp.]